MTGVSVEGLSGEQQAAVRGQLDRILKSSAFANAQRRRRFLEYVVGETLAGRADRLKGYSIAREVFDRPQDFDPNVDPIVRIEAGRLRDKLREFYDGEGRDDPVRIELPKGGYAPAIEFREVPPSPVAQPPAASPDGRASWPAGAAAALALIATLAVAVAWQWSPQPTAPASGRPSIAVLPFDNIGGDAKWQRLADGVTEDIITDLAHHKNLDVIARNSTAVYKGKPLDVREIGRALNVKYVLEGSIQPISERIRVTAQLIEASSGSHVWSERYDRPLDDVFAVQSEVTQRIAATLGSYGGAIAEAERRLIRRKPPASLTAFDTYLLGLEAKHKVTKDSLFEAERLLNHALELDPQLARAHVALVDTQFYLIDLGLAPSVDAAIAKLIASAERAVALDPNDGKAHAALGIANLYKGKPDQAAAEFDKAEALAPSDADTLLVIGWSMALIGQSQRGVRLAERALTLNPHHPDWYNQGLSFIFLFGEQFEKAILYRRLVKEPMALDFAFLAIAHAHLGAAADAAVAAANVARSDPTWNAERYLSEGGGYPEKEAELFVGGARKAGLLACVPAQALKEMPNLIRVKSCEAQRTSQLR